MTSDPAPADGGMFRSLSNRNYRLYFAGQGVSLIGTWLQAAAVRWLVYEQTGSADRLGVIEMANLMPGLVVGLFAGAISDRVAPRAMILAMEVGQMACAFVLASLVAAGTIQFWQMAVILATARVCVSFELPSRHVFLYELVGPERLTNAIALNAGMFNATRVIGPALAGVGFAVLGAAGCFTLNAVSYLAAIASVLAIRVPPRTRAGLSSGAALRDVIAGLVYLRGERRISGHLALMGFFGLMGMGYEAMTPVFARTILGVDVGGYSVLLASGGAGATLGALTVARMGDDVRKERMVVYGMLCFSTFLLAASLFPIWSSPTWPSLARLGSGAVCLFGAWFGAAFFYSSTQTLIQMRIPAQLRGRIMGVWMVVFSGSVPLGALWTGRAASIWGVCPVMGCSAAVCLTTGALLLLLQGRDDSSKVRQGA
ncbi:MFS transporter [Planctomyces sp. SH-PL62]|uniref:MFS transporter n=1 Tax=Planctomyces sp. SH-PL62 TaxID=1636152 RepID=UPI00078DEC64|nr:MFS transporter [Planctomyces sp. SH-PL62]AMV39441.1 enterobactin exporter EntS [Planctomyces sp. SH-PL62]